jgi:hypothetical protein
MSGPNTVIDFRTIPANVPSICIPRVFVNINEARIRKTIDELNMGIVDRIDIVSKSTEKGEKFNRVFIHFKKWFDEGNAAIARERLLNGKEIKIIYDDPWFWKVSAYREPTANKYERNTSLQQQKPVVKKAVFQFDTTPTVNNNNAPNVIITKNTIDVIQASAVRSLAYDNRSPQKRLSREDFNNKQNGGEQQVRGRPQNQKYEPRTPSSSPPVQKTQILKKILKLEDNQKIEKEEDVTNVKKTQVLKKLLKIEKEEEGEEGEEGEETK